MSNLKKVSNIFSYPLKKIGIALNKNEEHKSENKEIRKKKNVTWQNVSDDEEDEENEEIRVKDSDSESDSDLEWKSIPDSQVNKHKARLRYLLNKAGVYDDEEEKVKRNITLLSNCKLCIEGSPGSMQPLFVDCHQSLHPKQPCFLTSDTYKCVFVELSKRAQENIACGNSIHFPRCKVWFFAGCESALVHLSDQ